MRLEEDPERGDLEAAGGGASREGDGTWKVTLAADEKEGDGDGSTALIHLHGEGEEEDDEGGGDGPTYYFHTSVKTSFHC